MEDNKFSPSNNKLMSDDVRLISAAIRSAKRNFRPLTKSGENKNQKYAYATIDDLLEVVEHPLDNEGVQITHGCHTIPEGQEVLHTRLIHSDSGQFMADQRFIIGDKDGNQGRGASNTYMRKFALQSLLSLSCEDNDGEVKTSKSDLISEAQLSKIKAELGSFAPLDAEDIRKEILVKFKVDAISDLSWKQLNAVLAYIAECKE